jgi:glycosyltransferase involved in cell wall biosynthesis
MVAGHQERVYILDLSVIVPVYNEVDSLRTLHKAMQTALQGYDYELVYVDDGSSDGSVEMLEQICSEDPQRVCVVEFRRNFGQTAAIAAGIDFSHGDVVVLIDADLQEDPADIPMLVQKIEQGYDVVSGWRRDRQDAFLTRTLPSRMANGLISWVTGVPLHDYGCTLKAYRREVLQGFRLYGEMHRFIPAYAASIGARMMEVPVTHRPRLHGKAKYGLERTFKVVLDLFTVKFLLSYAKKPIYLFGGVGALLGAGSLVVLGILIARRVLLNEHMIRSPLLMMAMMLFILGVQSVMLGLIAELLVRTYHESQDKPTYTVRKVLGGRTAQP